MNEPRKDFNILDLSDQSTSPVFGKAGVSVSTAEKWDWNNPQHGRGEFRLISKTLLRIDGRYQRQPTSESRVFDIARNWDWALCGAISVAERPEEPGVFWVVEGGHRVRAALKHDKITTMPCMVFQFEDLSDEAKVFVAGAESRVTIAAVDRQRAAVFAGEPDAIRTQAIIEKHGYFVGKSNTVPYSFKAVYALQKIVRKDEALADRVFGLCVHLTSAPGDPITRYVLSGLFTYAKRLGRWFSPKEIARLAEYGERGLALAVVRKVNEVGRGGEYVYAQAIADILNKRRKQKVRLPTSGMAEDE